MKVTVTDLAGFRFICEASDNATIGDLKQSLQSSHGVSSSLQQIRLGGQTLADATLVSETAGRRGMDGKELPLTVVYDMNGGGFITTGRFEPHCKICCGYCGLTSLWSTCQCCCVYVGH